MKKLVKNFNKMHMLSNSKRIVLFWFQLLKSSICCRFVQISFTWILRAAKNRADLISSLIEYFCHKKALKDFLFSSWALIFFSGTWLSFKNFDKWKSSWKNPRYRLVKITKWATSNQDFGTQCTRHQIKNDLIPDNLITAHFLRLFVYWQSRNFVIDNWLQINNQLERMD